MNTADQAHPDYLGYNAIRILRSIGVFDDIVKEAGEDPASLSRMFQFISGMDGHELVYDVCNFIVIAS